MPEEPLEMVGRDEPVTTIIFFDFRQEMLPLSHHDTKERKAWDDTLTNISNETFWDYTMTGETYPVSNRWAVFIGKDWS